MYRVEREVGLYPGRLLRPAHPYGAIGSKALPCDRKELPEVTELLGEEKTDIHILMPRTDEVDVIRKSHQRIAEEVLGCIDDGETVPFANSQLFRERRSRISRRAAQRDSRPTGYRR